MHVKNRNSMNAGKEIQKRIRARGQFFLVVPLPQGSHGSRKNWKVMEFKNFIFQAKARNVILGTGKSLQTD